MKEVDFGWLDGPYREQVKGKGKHPDKLYAKVWAESPGLWCAEIRRLSDLTRTKDIVPHDELIAVANTISRTEAEGWAEGRLNAWRKVDTTRRYYIGGPA